jgi:heat shock protein HtpX
MSWFKRIFYFTLVNILVITSITVVMGLVNTFFFQGRLHSSTMGSLLVLSLVWGFGGAIISLLISKWMAKRMMGVQVIDPQTARGAEREILETVHRLARAARLSKMPEVGIYPSPEVNAFATGPSRNNSLVAVSSGLLQSMDRDQLEGVLGHEVAHIANGDMVTMTLIQGVINAFVIFFSRLIASAIAGGRDNRRGGGGIEFLLVIALQIAFGLLGQIAIGFFSRGREFRADKGGALYAGREKMISALQALERKFQSPQHPVEDKFASFKISSQKAGGFMALLSTHPPLETRIERLRNTPISR